jgi:hypothetical protein
MRVRCDLALGLGDPLKAAGYRLRQVLNGAQLARTSLSVRMKLAQLQRDWDENSL